MANETRKTKKGGRSKVVIVLLAIVLALTFTACTDEQVEEGAGLAFDILLELLKPAETENPDETQGETVPESRPETPVDGEMQVHFIDVGQADAALFVSGDEVMLFDAATYNRGDELVEYIQGLGIDYIDVLVLTHPHDDHMGGSSLVVQAFDIGTIYCPDIDSLMGDNGPGWYEEMEIAIEDRFAAKNPNEKPKTWDKYITLPRDKDGNFAEFTVGEAHVQFLAPLKDKYSDKNDYSICAIVSFGEVDIMLTGDATKAVEKDLLELNYDLDVEIFTASHHGSDTGNSREFIEAMSPECIIISCGMKNRHNHPVKSVMDLFKEMKIPVYRTDESGTIVLITDGIEYTLDKKPGTYTSGAEYKEGK